MRQSRLRRQPRRLGRGAGRGLAKRGASSCSSGSKAPLVIAAPELAGDGIAVNCISSGPFATEMTVPLMQDPELSRQFLSKIPLGRWRQHGDIGELALYLCSEQADFITGTDIVIDGGWTAPHSNLTRCTTFC